MKRGISIIGGVLLAATLSVPVVAVAKAHESQKGGLPALEEVVDAIQAAVATLQGQVTTLIGVVGTLKGQVTTLQGQNSWAVIEAGGTVARFSSNLGGTAPKVDHVVGSGVYEVNFGKNVTNCVYEATIGDTANALPAQGQISVSGDVDLDSGNDVYVQTFGTNGTTATDLPFHLFVSCN
jgi:type IV secretory pathway VirB2 component (pilin)